MSVRRLLMGGLGLLTASVQQLPASAASPPPADYRQLIAASDVITALRSKFVLASPPEVSQLRPSVLTQLGDWTACARVSVSGYKSPPPPSNATLGQQPARLPPLSYYAFFFADGALIESRPAVIIDHCADVTYAPLPPASQQKRQLKRR